MNTDKISLITISFNNFEELKLTLNSLENVSGIESLVINGGSCQNTLKFLSEGHIKHISEPDMGISDAFNKGAKNSTNDFIAYLNSGDTLTDKNYYKQALKIFKDNPEIDFIYAQIEIDHIKHGKMLVSPNEKLDFTKMPFPHPSLIVKKDVFHRIGDFDLNLKIAMDYDFAVRLINSGSKGYYYRQMPVVLMDGEGVSSHQGILGQKERIYILKKYQRLDWRAFIYHYKLLLKIHTRNILTSLGLIQFYDKIKNRSIEVKPE